MGFTRAQVDQLLKPINSNRVLKDGKNNSHVSQQDVTAHLIRIFGFGNFDTELLSAELVFEAERVNPSTGKGTSRWDVCYKATMRLSVKDKDGQVVCQFEDGSTATAQNQTRGDAHDLAFKSAISLAKKRCAIGLGDQFGLSLYNKGQTAALVKATYVMPEGDAAEGDLQDGVEQQVSLGNDEIERDLDASAPAEPATDPEWLSRMEAAIGSAVTPQQMEQIATECRSRGQAGQVTRVHSEHLLHLWQQRQGELAASTPNGAAA